MSRPYSVRALSSRLVTAGICLSVTILASVLLPGCSWQAPASDPQAAGRGAGPGGGGRGGRGADAGGAVPVTTAHVIEQAMPLEVTTVGTAEAFTTVDVRSQVTGQLTSVGFKEGDDVQQG